MKLILCVEDEWQVLENNRLAFADAGYSVLTAENLSQAREQLSKHKPDAIVLDIMLPDGLGLDLLTEIREQGNTIPVIMLTAWDKPYDVARGLRAGANDYLSKPFEYEELLARVETMFRNVEQMPKRINYKELAFNIPSGQALFRGKDLVLTPKEYALLLLLAQNERKIISAEEIYQTVWNASTLGDKNSLRATLSSLRKKIEHTGYDIYNIQGKGYYFE